MTKQEYFDEVVRVSAQVNKVGVAEILSNSREEPIAVARSMVSAVLASKGRFTSRVIGEVSTWHRTSAMHHVEVVEDKCKYDREFRKLYQLVCDLSPTVDEFYHENEPELLLESLLNRIKTINEFVDKLRLQGYEFKASAESGRFELDYFKKVIYVA